MSVDLPAPLPPTSPTTSPGYRSTVTPWTALTPPNATSMPRISTSGVRLGAVAGVASTAGWGIAIWSARPSANERVETDRPHEDDADDDVLGGRVDQQQGHA